MTVTAETARKQLDGMNSVNVAPIPRRLKKFSEEKPIRIFNVSPHRWVQSLGSLGHYTVHACEPGQRYSKPCEVPAMVFEGIRTDMRNIEQRPWDGEEVALDIVGQGRYKSKDQDLTQWGVFIAAGEVPTEAELLAAEAKLTAKEMEQIRQADEFYAQGPNFLINITAAMRMAAAKHNLNKPWATIEKPMGICPACGDPVNPNAIVHAGKNGCGAVLNEAEVIRTKLKGYEHLWEVKRGPGRPKNEETA